MKMFKSRAGFTLIELLVVIGILAVLAAIAIPSVAGLIDRANVSADNTNCNEMTNAIERFTSEYELYCQDIASGVIKDVDSNGVPDDMDGAQGRVFNVTKAMTRANITALESTGLGDRQINRDTKYPTNLETLKAIVENYTKTSSATFEPKQSDCSFYYSPDCGVVVCAPTDATVPQLNALILSGKDAKGNTLTDSTAWSNVTLENALNNNVGEEMFYCDLCEGEYTVDEFCLNCNKCSVCATCDECGQDFCDCTCNGGNNDDNGLITFTVNGKTLQAPEGMTWRDFVDSSYNPSYTCDSCEFPATFVYEGRYAISVNIYGSCDDCTGTYRRAVCLDGNSVSGDSEIINGAYYTPGSNGHFDDENVDFDEP